MDIKGQFSSDFVITDQTFDEQFKIILETTVSTFDKSGNLTSIVKADLLSKTFVIDRSIRSKCHQGLDVRQLFVNQMKKEEITNSPKIALLLYLESFTLKTHDRDQTKTSCINKATLNPADNQFDKRERNVHSTNSSFLDTNYTSSRLSSRLLLQVTDAALNETKKHENVRQLSRKFNQSLHDSEGYLKQHNVSLGEPNSP